MIAVLFPISATRLPKKGYAYQCQTSDEYDSPVRLFGGDVTIKINLITNQA